MKAPKLNPLKRDEQSSRSRSSQVLFKLRYKPVHAWFSVSQKLKFAFFAGAFCG